MCGFHSFYSRVRKPVGGDVKLALFGCYYQNEKFKLIKINVPHLCDLKMGRHRLRQEHARIIICIGR